MRNVNRLVMAVFVLVGAITLTATSVPAQQPGKGKGFGGGMGGGALNLIRSKTVQEDVKITEDQGSKLKEWAKDYAPKMQEMMKSKMEGIDPSQFREKMPAIQAAMAVETYKELGAVLKPEQIARLKQIEVQMAGTRAFAMPAVTEALKLKDEQKEKLKDVTDSAQKETMDLGQEYGSRFGQPPMDAEKAKEFNKKMAAITDDTMKKVMGMMSDDQKKAWKEVAGAPIDLAKVRTETAGPPRKKKDD